MTVVDSIIERIARLRPEEQREVLDFIDFLAKREPQEESLFNPEGLWSEAGTDVSAEDIAEARREMWAKFVDDQQP